MQPRQRGFTLIEILVALTVFAVVSASLLTNASQMVNSTRAIRDKSVAQWIAVNEVNRLKSNVRTDEHYPSPGTSTSDVRMAEIDWIVAVSVEDTENRDVRRITVDVSRRTAGADAPPVLSLAAFVGRY